MLVWINVHLCASCWIWYLNGTNRFNLLGGVYGEEVATDDKVGETRQAS